MTTEAARLSPRLAPAQPAAQDTTPPPRHALLLAVCCVAQFMVILDVSIVNVALPSIHTSLGFSETQLSWVINAYTITFAGFLMLSGRAADLLGGRSTFVTGLLLFAAASLIGGTAVDREVLVGARALQGLGGAVMAASSLAIITSSFAPGPERHRAIGLWGAMNGAGGATGTLLGGIITQELTWRWVLLINLPIGIAAALVARVVVVDRRREDSAADFDLAGALAITGGLLSLVYGIVNAGQDGWGSPAALGPIGLGLALLATFVLIEGRIAQAPLVPLRVFSNRLLRVSNIVVIFFSAALFPMWYFGTRYLQEVLHMGPLDAGLAFLPMALTIMAFATRAGALVARFGVGRVLGVGLTLMALGLALFTQISVNGNYVSDFMLPGLLTSIGVGLSVVPSTIAATATAPPSEAGLASGLVNTSRQMGGALGLAILASLAVLFTGHLIDSEYTTPIVALNDGFRLAFGLGALSAATGALIAFRLIPKSLHPPSAASAPAPPASAQAPASEAPPGPRPPLAEVPSSAPAPVAQQPQPVPIAVAPPPTEVTPAPPPPAALPAQVSIPPQSQPPAPVAAPSLRPVRHVSAVVLTVAGGGSWAMAKGSMTLSVAGTQPPRETL